MDKAHKDNAKPKLTDAQRQERFLEVAEKVGASNDPKDFERAFKAVALARKRDPKPPAA